MKKLILIAFLTIPLLTLEAQILNPVKWETSVVKVNETDYDLVATATIDAGWHLYSQTVPKNGPWPTSFQFTSDKAYQKRGNTKEEIGHTTEDEIFKMTIKYFDNKASFKQRVRLKGKAPLTVEGIVEFMVCDESKCLPPTEVDLLFNIK